MTGPRPHIERLDRSATAGYPRGRYLRLDRNELVPDIARGVFDGIIGRLTPTTFTCYPATGPLYDALAASTGTTARNILVGAGSDWLIRNIFDVFCEPCTRVVIPVPTYGMYEVYAKASQAELVLVDYESDFRFPTQAVLAEVAQGPGILALANPNGALGSAIDAGELREILVAARQSDMLVVIDEAYVEYLDTNCVDYIGTFSNMVLVRTFSKALGLAGLRVGYALADESLIRSMAKLRPNVEVNQVAVEAATYLLENESLVASHVAASLEGKADLCRILRNFGFPVFEGHANFIQVKFGDYHSVVLEQLQAKDILVKSDQDPLLKGWTRITIGPPKEMKRVVECVRLGMKK